MRITMIGTGYVGLVSGACFADFGHHVVCMDKDEAKISALKEGRIPIFEPGLERLVATNVREGRLSFTTHLDDALHETDAVFIAVGTPSRRGDGHADLSYVFEAAADVARAVKGEPVLVMKSTVPVGTGDQVEAIVRNVCPDRHLEVVSNPEFLREGAAIEDFKRPDRVVIGTLSETARQVMAELYRPLTMEGTPFVFTSRRTSELIKYAANAFLAMKITYINEMADLCEKVGADVQEVARGIGLDQRIGRSFLQAGPGYGGSCFPKDTLALVKTAEDARVDLSLVEATVSANTLRKQRMANKIVAALGSAPYDKTVAVLGLTFKPNTDDLRDSPALAIIEGLLSQGLSVRAFDPEGMEGSQALLPDVFMAQNPFEAAEGADALVLATEWDAFRALDLNKLKGVMRQPLLFDLRNVYDPQRARAVGFTYYGVGRFS